MKRRGLFKALGIGAGAVGLAKFSGAVDTSPDKITAVSQTPIVNYYYPHPDVTVVDIEGTLTVRNSSGHGVYFGPPNVSASTGTRVNPGEVYTFYTLGDWEVTVV